MIEPQGPPPPPPPPAPDAPTPELAPAAEPDTPPAWEPPLSFSDYFSFYSVKAIRYVATGFALLALGATLLWVVPTVAVSQSEAYGQVKAHVTGNASLRGFLGTPLVADRVPEWYRIGEHTSSFELVVRGPRGSARVVCELQDGRISKFDTTYALGWMGDPPPRRRRERNRE